MHFFFASSFGPLTRRTYKFLFPGPFPLGHSPIKLAAADAFSSSRSQLFIQGVRKDF